MEYNTYLAQSASRPCKCTQFLFNSLMFTRFIQKVPGLGGYLNKLTSFHPDISYSHFSSKF